MRQRKNWILAIPLIVVGLAWQLRNMGYIDSDALHIVVSWQALLIYFGVVNLLRKQYVGGSILLVIGSLFMLPQLGILHHDWLRLNWPVALIIAGLFLLFRPRSGRHERGHYFKKHGETSERAETASSSDNGFVDTSNYFGSVKQIVLDPVFRGARISNAFGGTVIDLRHTSLDAPETSIDVDCIFGGVEIFLPGNWLVQNNTTVIMGGCEDKRFQGREEIDKKHTLILRGNIIFGGVEIKN